ncbi:polysaccharide deacetylase family protein [Sinomonas mesophila]|uniref:polysaccharide deacetylase family protein n=1 Tax=Sinomonas mesophila TaxID=1531955 RepID=UPI000987A093|nr:polysaccharide deacetylase family protein [Sinomonas mesophila]
MAVLGGRRLALVVSAIAALLLVAAAVAIAVLRPAALEGAAPPPTTGAPASAGPATGSGQQGSIASGEPAPTESADPTGIPAPPPGHGTPGEPAPGEEPGPADTPVPAPAPPPQPGSQAPSPQPVPPPSNALPDALRGLDIERIPTTQRIAALTFDAGASSAGLPSILATLRDEGVPATFFVTGQWALANPGGVAGIAAAGHRLASHSMTHAAFTGLSDAEIGTDLARAQAAIMAVGADPRPLFRFPYGDRDARTIAAVNANGYAAVRWTVDSLGWQGTMGGTRGPDFVVSRVMGAAQHGLIALMHVGSHPEDGSTLDADALPALIAQLRAAGYGFVTLEALL